CSELRRCAAEPISGHVGSCPETCRQILQNRLRDDCKWPRWRRRWFWRLIMAGTNVRRILVVAAVGAVCAACPPGQTSELRFLQFGQVLDSESTAGANTYEANELATVPDTSLPLFVDMRATSANVGFVDNQNVLRGPHFEAHLFAVDLAGAAPDGVNDFFRTYQAASPIGNWDTRTNL